MTLALLIVSCATAKPEAAAAQVSVQDGLDTAIRNASDYINKNVPKGSKLVILNIKSKYAPLSEYIIDVLTGNVVNDRVFTVVDRANLSLIQQEMDFQLSGEVSDESAQSIGQKLGAQTIVSGSITSFGDLWRLTVRVLGVENATVLGLYNENVPSSSTIAALSSGPETVEPVKSPTVAPRTAAASASPQTVAAQSVPAPAPAAEPPPAPATPPAPTVYKVGDKGPAGGIVFYDKGVVTNGWRYLEAAPNDVGPVPWGLTGTIVRGTSTGIGTGKRNTDLIIAALSNSGGGDGAALLCTAFEINGYNDWYLPSKDELDLMYKNLKAKGVGNFGNNYYWSSSDNQDNYAWDQRFSDGSQDNRGTTHDHKDKSNSVRAIRQF
jgi:TolB-like protein